MARAAYHDTPGTLELQRIAVELFGSPDSGGLRIRARTFPGGILGEHAPIPDDIVAITIDRHVLIAGDAEHVRRELYRLASKPAPDDR